MEKLAEGGYGCVLIPSMKCNNKENVSYEGKVSKLMTDKNAEIEFNQVQSIAEIDPKFYYHIKTPIICKPKISEDDFKVIKKCQLIQMNHDITREEVEDGTSILIYENGGKTWAEFTENINTLKPEQVLDFLISAYTTVRGVQHMTDKKFMHTDIRIDNVLYDMDKKRSNIIDFGLAGKIENVESFFETRSPEVDDWHICMCPEFRYLHRPFFDSLQINLKKEWSRNREIQQFQDSSGYKNYIKYLFSEEQKQINIDIVNLFEVMKNSSYNDFVSKSVNLCDSYGIGFTLVCVTYEMLKHGKLEKNDEALIKKIRDLGISASRIVPDQRLSAKDLAHKYEQCIMDHVSPHPNIPLQFKNFDAYKTYVAESLFVPTTTFTDSISTINTKSRWIHESVLISTYEDELRLSLVDFVDHGAYKKLFKDKDLSFDKINSYLNNLDTCKRRVNIRPIEKETGYASAQNRNRHEACLFLDYMILLQSRYSVNITTPNWFEKECLKESPVPCIMLLFEGLDISFICIKFREQDNSPVLSIPFF